MLVMRKLFLAVSLVVLLALMTFGSGSTQIIAQQPTSTPSPTPYPAITVVVANFSLTGTRGINFVPNAVLNAITSLNLRTVNVVRTQPISTAEVAQQTAARFNAALVIWGAPEGEAGSRHLVIHYDVLGRQSILDANPLTRRNVTLTGLYGLPDTAEITAFGGIPAAALTAFTQAQLFLTIADDARAKDLLLAADQAADNINVTVEADVVYANWLRSEVAFYRAYLAIREGNSDIASDQFRDILTSVARPSIMTWTNINAGALAIQRQRFDDAISALEQAVDLDDGTALAYVNLGTAYWWKGDTDRALESFDTAAGLAPNNTYALNDRGYALLQINQPDEALENFHQVFALDPNFVDAYINQALLYRTLGDYDLALRDINVAIRLVSQRDVYPYVLRADIYNARGENDLALADLDRALLLDANDAYALTLWGDILAKQGRDTEAFTAYNLAISLTPNNPYLYLQRAQLYLRANKYKDAAVDATSALALGQANPTAVVEAYFYRAEAFSGLTRFDEAIADYQRYLEQAVAGRYVEVAKARIESLRTYIIPTATNTPTRTPQPTITPTLVPSMTNTPIPPTLTTTPTGAELNQRADSLAEQGRDLEAISVYTSSIVQEPNNPYTYLQRAKVYLRIPKYKDAFLDASAALALGKDNMAVYVDAYFYRGEANNGLGRFAEAIADYQSYIDLAPDGKFVEVAKTRIIGVTSFLPPTATITRIPPTQTPVIIIVTPTSLPATATNTATATIAATATLKASVNATPTSKK